MSGGLTYRQAGVDIAAADTFVARVARLAAQTHGPEVVAHASRYAGLFSLGAAGAPDYLLAGTCDGVGTKLLVARDAGEYAGLGQDLVAMSVNDLVPLGARPLFFLDYLATGKLDAAAMGVVVEGIAAACRAVGCALIGGETAEMPGVYPPGDFDLAGFAVGLVRRDRLPAPERMRAGDVALALPSTGLHANGFSLARAALLERGGLRLDSHVPELGRTLAAELLAPTALYVVPVLALHERFGFKAAGHITGGGLLGRGAALMSPGCRLRLERARFRRPPVFDMIQRCGGVSDEELGRTFNLGLGFVAIVEREVADAALAADGSPWLPVGEVIAGERGVELV